MLRAVGVRTVPAIRPPHLSKGLGSAKDWQTWLHRNYANDTSSPKQSTTFEGYYEDLLDAPLRSVQPATRTAPVPPPIDEAPSSEKDERIAKARVVFGSRLAGPGERKKAIDANSQMIAGVMVPPRPEEPENCCMSGCVNCVWDQYRDEIEEWAAKSAEARQKMNKQRMRGEATGMMVQDPDVPKHVAVSMDDDGGGSETSWSSGADEDADGADLFAGIPVGIKEFMRTEKKLKEKKLIEKRLKENGAAP